MSGLPKGWAEPSLDELCDLNPKHDPETDRSLNVSFVPMPAVDDETGAIVDRSVVRPLSEIWKGYTHFSDRDVIFAKITPCMENGKIAVASHLANGMACGSTEFHVLRSKGAVEPDFLWRFLRRKSYRQVAERSMTGAVGQRRVPKQFLETTVLPLPPLAEQKRIVAKLDALNAKSVSARTELARIEILVLRYKQAVLSKAFSGDQCGGDKIQTTAVGNIAHVTKGASPKWQGFDYKESGIRFIRSQNVGWGELILDDEAFLDPSFNVKQRNSIIEEHDILLNIVGASIGRTAVVDTRIAGANCNQAVAIIKPLIRERGLSDYICYWLQTPEAQEAIRNGAVDVARANFSLGEIKKLHLPWPSSVRQHEIVRRIESAFAKIDRLAAEAQRARELVGKLDEAILAKAFRGELVPQDENDEPASALLKRISAEREAAPKTKRGRGTLRAKR